VAARKGTGLIETEKLFLFDVGVANHLARRTPRLGSPDFGKSFEHYVLMELRGYHVYRQSDLELSFWRTASGHEVNFVLGDMRVAIEVKAGKRVHDGDLGGLRALAEEHRVRHRLVVCLEDEPRRLADGIEVVPWRQFLDRLWEGDLSV
jgi:predicted AAA+ superfamily ATPase